MKKLITMLSAVVAAVTLAWADAPTPVAVWDRDFSTTEKDGYTFTANGNTVGPDGTTLIMNRGTDTTKAATITWTAPESSKPYTVIVRHNGLPAHTSMPTLATTIVGTEPNRTGVCLVGNTFESVGYWNGSTNNRPRGNEISQTSGCYVMIYNPVGTDGFSKGTYLKTLIDGTLTGVHSEEGLVRTGDQISGVCVGGNGANKTSNYENLEITGVAIFDKNLTDKEITAYEWPSDPIYKRYEANFANRMMTWTTAAATSTTAVDMGGASTFIGSKASYQGNQNTTALPGYTSSTLAWRGFCNSSNVSGYSAPGLVLHMPAYTEGKTVKVGGTFSPFTLGGLIVDEGAGDGDNWAALEQISGDRTTALGDMRTSGGVPTFFTLRDNFQIKRNNGDVTFYGDVTLDIAEGKVFDCNTTYATKSASLDAGTKTTLRMIGAGKMKVIKLWADRAVTLDFSAQAKNNTAALIEGPVAVNESTTIVLPADMEIGDSYIVATSFVGTPGKVMLGSEKLPSLVSFTADENGTITLVAGEVVAKIGDREYGSVADAIAGLQEGETIDDIVVLSDAAEVPADYKLVEKDEAWGIAPRDPTTVYASQGFGSYSIASGKVVKLIDGDAIVCDRAHMGGNNWNGGKNPSEFANRNISIEIKHEMDFGGNATIPSGLGLKINYREGNTKGVYLYGNIAEGVTIGTDDDAGLLFLGHSGGNTVIGAGATIACDIGFQGTNIATINGAVTISGDVVTTTGCHIKLAEGATLTTVKIAEEGEEITHVGTDVAGKEVQYADGMYKLVDKKTPQRPEAIEHASDAVKTAFDAWVAKFEVADPVNANVDCFLMGIADAEDPELLLSEEDLAVILDAETLEAAVAQIATKYPNAKVELITVEGLPETCYKLKLSLPTEAN